MMEKRSTGEVPNFRPDGEEVKSSQGWHSLAYHLPRNDDDPRRRRLRTYGWQDERRSKLGRKTPRSRERARGWQELRQPFAAPGAESSEGGRTVRLGLRTLPWHGAKLSRGIGLSRSFNDTNRRGESVLLAWFHRLADPITIP